MYRIYIKINMTLFEPDNSALKSIHKITYEYLSQIVKYIMKPQLK